MRVLFSSRPSFGHVYPLMPLALAMRDQGHEVVFGVGPGFVERLQALGFEAHESGPTIQWAHEEALRREPALQDLPAAERLRLGAAIFAELLPAPVARDLLRVAAADPPALVVYEASDFGAAVAAAAIGTPAVLHAYGTPWPPAMLDLVRPPLEALAAEHGVRGRVDPVLGDVYVDIAPASLGDAAGLGPPRRLAQRPVPFSEPDGGLPATFERTDRLLAYVTLGTVVNDRVDVLRLIAGELAGLGHRVVVAAGPGADFAALRGLPDTVDVRAFVRQDRMLERAGLVVSHCGSGTMLGAFAHGIPQLAVPQGADQFFNAAALERSGAGLALMPADVTAEAVRAAARRLTGEPAFGAAARALRDEIAAMPAPAEVARELAAMV